MRTVLLCLLASGLTLSCSDDDSSHAALDASASDAATASDPNEATNTSTDPAAADASLTHTDSTQTSVPGDAGSATGSDAAVDAGAKPPTALDAGPGSDAPTPGTASDAAGDGLDSGLPRPPRLARPSLPRPPRDGRLPPDLFPPQLE